MEGYSINISVKKNQISPGIETAEIVNFHFSHYKSMGTISCHSNQSSYPTGIKNTTFVEANVLSIYTMHNKFSNCFSWVSPSTSDLKIRFLA